MVLQKIDVETGFLEMVGLTLPLHMLQVVYYVRAYLVETGPKKRIKVEDLSTVTIGYIKDKHPDRLDENLRFRILFDSGCSATLIKKSLSNTGRNNQLKP
jgi:hypothetical protein